MAKNLILWGIFQRNESAFDQAVAAGDLIQKGSMYFWAEVASGRKKTQGTGMKADGGEVSLEANEFDALGTFVESRPFAKFGQHSRDAALAVVGGAFNPSSSSQPGEAPQFPMPGGHMPAPKALKAIQDAPRQQVMYKWTAVEKQVADAKSAQERLLRDSGRYASKLKATKDEHFPNMLKECVALLNANTNKLMDCQMWQEPR